MYCYLLLRPLSGEIHIDNAKWWQDLETGRSLLHSRNRLALLMLVVTEVSEYVDGRASGAPDQHLPEWLNWQIELADIAIRLLDMIGAEESLGHINHDVLPVKEDGVIGLVSALSLAAESHRKGRYALYCKVLNTALSIVCRMAEKHELDLAEAVRAKRTYNATRIDHSHAARRAAGGKKE